MKQSVAYAIIEVKSNTLDNAKSWECMPLWSRLKLGPRRSISATKHQKDSASSFITYNIGDKKSLIPYKPAHNKDSPVKKKDT